MMKLRIDLKSKRVGNKVVVFCRGRKKSVWRNKYVSLLNNGDRPPCGIQRGQLLSRREKRKNYSFCVQFNPDFALGRGIRRMMPEFSVLKKFVRCPKSPSPFFVGKVSAVGSASFVSVLTPNAKSGFNVLAFHP